MQVLAGDIGGTKTLLAIVELDDTTARIEVEQRYDSRAHPGLTPIVRDFISRTSAKFDRAGFGVAGPVIDNRSQTTNLPWVVDASLLRTELGIGPARLVNDFVAASLGVLRLGPSDTLVLNPGVRVPNEPIVVLGAGTGLGEAFLSWNGDRYEVLASEGGHSDFAPSDEVQVGLWRHLAAKFGHVSWERVVSGMGIANIYEYMSSAGTFAECPAVRDAIKAGGDVAPVVSAHALNANDPLCTAVMDVFVRAYGAEAGNLALKLVARGGVYLAGGIATKIMPLLTDGRFRTAYCEKGRFRTLVESIPAYVVTHPRVGVLGAAVAACAK